MNPSDVSTDLAAAYAVEDRDLHRLHQRLASAASADHLLDVAYRVLDSPVGPLLVAGTRVGLVRIAFAVEGHDAVLQSLSDQISSRLLESAAALDPIARQLDGYFAGRRRAFDVPLDWRLSTGFRLTVLHHLAEDVDYGTTASYAALAGLAGNPKAVRAVGTACATNPIPVVVPCHRVVRSDGAVGAYRGGPEAKLTLIDLEAAG